MKAKHVAVQLAIIITALVFTGCWKTVGKIDMTKLITIDELWQNRAEYEGKVVTLELDSSLTVSVGTLDPIRGTVYHAVGMHFSPVMSWEWDSIKSYINRNGIKYVPSDTVRLGSFAVYLIGDAEKTPALPDWISHEQPLQRFEWEKDLGACADSKKKVVTGIYMRGYEDFSGNNDYFPALISSRQIVIYPLGIRFMSSRN